MAIPSTFSAGFYEILGFSRYCINPTGFVIDKVKKIQVKPSKNPKGYLNLKLVTDDGFRLTVGLHRVLCIAFKSPPAEDFSRLVVNHINGKKNDNRLKNLEWVTYLENLEHAGRLGLTTKCKQIEIRNSETGEVLLFPSFKKCALHLGISKDAIVFRIKSNGTRIFPDGYQYRVFNNDCDWPLGVDIGFGQTRSILLKNRLCGTVLEFDTVTASSNYLKIPVASIVTALKKHKQAILNPLWVCQYKSTFDGWLEFGDFEKEYQRQLNKRIVYVVKDQELKIYASAAQAATALGYKISTMHYVLSNNINNAITFSVEWSDFQVIESGALLNCGDILKPHLPSANSDISMAGVTIRVR